MRHMKTVLRVKLNRCKHLHLKVSSEFNTVTLHLQELEKEQTKPKANQKKETGSSLMV